MANPTSICNQALSLIGDATIDTYGDEGTKGGRFCLQFFEQARDEVLTECVAFQETRKRVELAALSTAPAFGWEYAYQFPADCLRVIDVVHGTDYANDYSRNVKWTVEDRKILTDQDECFVVYIKRPTVVGSFSPMLVKAIVTNLASKLAIPLAAKPELADYLTTRYKTVDLLDAMADNAAQGHVEDEHDTADSQWTDAGRY